MITSSHRFHGHNGLKHVYQKGKQIRGAQLGLKVAPRVNNRQYRVAVVVSRKVHKSAVVRNRIRRRIYEIVRTNPELIPTNCDLVFTVFGDSLATEPADKLQASITGLLQKASKLGE